jgi:hypothetical protein
VRQFGEQHVTTSRLTRPSENGGVHIHVDARLGGEAATRNMLAATFGLVGDLPGVVMTGCGIEVSVAETSRRPEMVTCLACREHAHRRHLEHAADVERIARMPGSPFTAEQAKTAAEHHRELARRFAQG